MAGELILILRDFFAPGDESLVDTAVPRLPALETLLATARRDILARGWRAEFAARFGGGLSLVGLPLAEAVANAWLGRSRSSPSPSPSPSQSPSARYWLATPVYYFAGLDSVQLHPAGLLEMPLEAQAALASDFNAVFADDHWRLHATGRRELLLAGPALEADGDDPARFLGSKLGRQQMRGAGAPELRRLAVEIEMWLHEHAINRQRQSSGELLVSGLWLWGSEPLLRTASEARPERALADVRLYGRDTVAEALWRRRAGTSAPLPERLAMVLESTADAHVVLYPTAGMEGATRALERLEEDWLAPALAALRTGALAAVQLLAGTHAYHLRRLNLARFWRARSPWQEALA
ncbi:MAG TPA: hypothetical protein VGP20_09225 [Steroidobacteraceae bacterium]|jgi:hypothetical protein|nr:hypothetical protein [Steroidobacteraceae bacterium]